MCVLVASAYSVLQIALRNCSPSGNSAHHHLCILPTFSSYFCYSSECKQHDDVCLSNRGVVFSVMQKLNSLCRYLDTIPPVAFLFPYKGVCRWVLWFIPGVGRLLVVLCRSNVAKSPSVPTHPSPPYFYIQQPLKHVNLILSKLSFLRDVKTGIALKELYASI